ncbi:MAG TPA: GAF domain-containing sensor histidine kinase, partial [Thermoplasmata archaeon]|nr:GAF domain-containing sensor histidine kinase [Thermoplasmata archaeon]
TILEIIVRRVASTLHSHDVSLFLYDPDTKALSCKASFGLTSKEPEADVPLGEGAIGWAARHREPLLMHANEREARFAEHFMTHSDAGSALILPVTVENRCLAVLQVHRAAKAEPFRIQHRDIGKLFADNVGAAIERALVVTKLQERAADRKQPSAAQAHQTLAFQDSFLSAAETELKNPITAILAYAEVLDQNEKRMTSQMRHEFTSRLRGETERLLAMVDEVLDLARLETGRFLLDLRVDNVNKVARAALDTVRPVAAGKHIELEVKLDEKIPDQHLDTTKVKQAMLHLLRNAVRFSPAKGWITLATWLCDDHVRIEVRDSGPSVEPEAAAMVFDLQGQASPASRRVKDGMGFGLHLAKRFIDLHGGEVGVDPGPSGLGVVFWIRLPRGDGPEAVIGKDPFLHELWQGGSDGPD